MKKIRFTEAQIVGILTELHGGTPTTELARNIASTPTRFGSGAIATPGFKLVTWSGSISKSLL